MIYPFKEIVDFKKYKKENPYYCEAIISPSGKIYESKPSHQVCLGIIIAHKKKMSYDDFIQWVWDNCTFEEKLDWINYLTSNTHWIAIWKTFYAGIPNARQYNTIKKLKKSGIYEGKMNQKTKKLKNFSKTLDKAK